MTAHPRLSTSAGQPWQVARRRRGAAWQPAAPETGGCVAGTGNGRPVSAEPSRSRIGGGTSVRRLRLRASLATGPSCSPWSEACTTARVRISAEIPAGGPWLT